MPCASAAVSDNARPGAARGLTTLLLLSSALLSAPAPARCGESIEPAILRLIDLSLDESWGKAHALADSLIHLAPDCPETHFYKAVVLWRQGMNDRHGDRFDPGILRCLSLTIDRAEADIRRRGETPAAFLWLGNALGLRTGLEMLRGEIFKGVMDGSQGREYLFEAMRLDPDLVDAKFGIGLSDYVLSQKPALLRVVQRLLSLPAGDRNGGLAMLEDVIAHGTYSRADALSARAYIDLYYERHRASGRDRMADLLRRYPNSLDYRIRYADALLALAFEQGDDVARALVDSTRSIRDLAAKRGIQLLPWRDVKLAFTEGTGCYLLRDFDGALPLLARVVSASHVDDNWLLGPALVMLGKAADLGGRREEARAFYRDAERHEDVWGSRREARNGQVKAFDGKEPERHPKDDVARYPERP